MPKLCLNMIVKNEAARIERCLSSVAPFIDYYVITDTGSTDDTVAVIQKFFVDRKISGRITHAPFHDWSQARNNALLAARAMRRHWDYLLLVDADMELVVADKKCFDKLDGAGYDMQQRAGTLHYMNRRLVHRDQTGQYVGVTHEYLDVPAAGAIQGAYFIDHADGSNRPEKFKRDIRLLSEDILKDPNNGRSWFYLAQSYRDAGQPLDAANAYKRRIEIGGWDEEVWYSQYSYAHCLKDLKDEDGFLREMLKAYQMRPSRVESLYDLAQHFRNKDGMQHISTLFSEAGMQVPYSGDALFVSDYAYVTGCREEFAITAFYNLLKRQHAYKVCNELALDKRGLHSSREQAKNNLFYYIQPLKVHAPSFSAQKIGFVPPENWLPLNPSVVNVDGELVTTVRTVNYNITPDGRYEIRGGDGSITNDNPINTRNFIVTLNHSLSTIGVKELIWTRPPVQYSLVVGLEDVRLFEWGDDLHGLACVREQNPQGLCQQVLFEIEQNDNDYRVSEWKVLKSHQDYEKNWMPFGDMFVYRIGALTDGNGLLQHAPNVHLDVGSISGGSQVIPFNNAWLALVHESRHLPDTGKRYYQHRFVLMDDKAGLISISKPFVFHDRQIEFAAGLAWHPDGKRLVISYGVADREAWIATIHQSDVWIMVQ
jgi:glycosyltransferase involved in cell wall biosynthesis/predicted GH43/DUF377 family glycosyl hydrolase